MEEKIDQKTIKRNLPRDVFLHLFAMVALYWSAISFITLCWQYINYFFPNLNQIRYGYQDYLWPIRFSVSSLIIIFPLFLIASWSLNKIYRKESQVRESKIRKWLIYFTLFTASLIIIGDLVSLIYNFLGGDITLKFVLKAVSVLAVATVVFGYYLDDVRRNQPSKSAKYFAFLSGILILILVFGAFFIVGSPNHAREIQIDQQRVSDLQGIQSQIVGYWQAKGKMPQALSDLNDSISGYVAPVDPVTNQPYQYNLTDESTMKFELCAVFSLSSDQSQTAPKAAPEYPAGYLSRNWNHSAGRVCFERQIDKQIYPPINKVR